jgi:hypothetical protein
MSQTNWLIFKVTQGPGKQPDGFVQLTYTITNGVLQGSAVFAYKPTANDPNSVTKFTTPNSATATGNNNGTNITYTVSNLSDVPFNFPPAGTFLGGPFNTVVSLVLTTDLTGANATLAGTFKNISPAGTDDPCLWTADTTGEEEREEHASQKASGKP